MKDCVRVLKVRVQQGLLRGLLVLAVDVSMWM
jgi:hypothetical protein